MKHKNSSVVSTLAMLLLAGLAYVALGPTVPRAWAQTGCSASSLNGNYGFRLNKWTSNPNASANGIIGIMSFDGSGNMSGSFTSYNAGSVPPVETGTFTGNYLVSSDCSGSMSFTVSSGDTVEIAMVLANGAALVELLQTNDNGGNQVNTGTARRQ